MYKRQTPNSAIILPHVAVRSLVALNAVDACVKAIGTENSTLALWALRYMHDPKAVSGLINAYQKSNDAALKKQIIVTLSRLYKKEADYDGSWWWSTRPDTHGPYYKGITWEASTNIKDFLIEESKKLNDKPFFVDLNSRHRMEIPDFGVEEVAAVKEEVKIDLDKIRNKKGQVGEASIEDVMLAMAKIQGDAALGKTLFTQQGCIACHSLSTVSYTHLDVYKRQGQWWLLGLILRWVLWLIRSYLNLEKPLTTLWQPPKK